MAKDKGRRSGKTGQRNDDEEIDLEEDDERSSSESHSDSLERAFSSSNWRRAVEGVVSEYRRKNDRLLTRNRDLRERVAELEEKEPADDERVLTKDEAAEFDAFKALKLKPAEITAALTERDTLKGKETERTEVEQYADAAQELGFENVPLFTSWLKKQGLHLEFRDERAKDDNDKPVTIRVPVVRAKSDDKAQLEALADYIEREVPEFIPSFQAKLPSDDEGDEDVAGVATGSDVVTRPELVARSRPARRPAAETTGGVRMPAVRGIKPSTGAARTDKAFNEEMERQRVAGGYSL